ncbi:MAG TPA: endonuclease/exonuclease/phosphatase family protein [Natronosporangium sp.]|nr:endonuclease/exonuclease/phosphatase family protein [Natronosporangium sp.]
MSLPSAQTRPPAQAPSSSPARPPAAAVSLLVAAVFLAAVELLRATSPLLDLVSATAGVVGAAQLAVLIFLAPALVGGLVAAIGLARATTVTVLGLLGLRLAAQVPHPPPLLLVAAGAAVGIAALVLVVAQTAAIRSPVAATIGVLLGGVADLAVRAGYSSWDPLVRPGIAGWPVTLLVGAGLAVAWWRVRSAFVTAPAVRAGALGPYLGLYVLSYGSAPILAAHAGVSLTTASLVLIATAVLTIEVLRRMRLPGGNGAIWEPQRWFAGLLALVGLGIGLVGGYWWSGAPVVVAFALAGGAAAVLLARALTPRPQARSGRPGIGFTAAGLLAGLGYVAPVMLYQVHFELEFPFDNRLVLLAAALALGLAGMGARPASEELQPGRRGLFVAPALVSGVAAVALVVPLAMAVTRPAPAAAEPPAGSIRLMSWNLHYGRHHTDGVPDLEAIATAVEAVAPDVLTLQEVSRGWPIGGGVDMAEWLSRRLGMTYYWSPAADGQFGNVIFTRLPVQEVTAGRLPFVQGPMQRSYQAVTVPMADGRTLRLINAHLQHRKVNTPTRLVQSEALHQVWGGRAHTVVAGDFNFWPSWPEARLWRAAGFISAQDVTGHGAEFTVPSDAPDNRVDWIFGTPDLTFRDFRIVTEARVSDHFPLVVTVVLD